MAGPSQPSRWNAPISRSRSTSMSRRTPIGIIARLEHLLDRMDTELEEQRRRGIEAKARLAGYAPRLGEMFPLQGELEAKLGQLAEIEFDLARTEHMTDETNPAKPETPA